MPENVDRSSPGNSLPMPPAKGSQVWLAATAIMCIVAIVVSIIAAKQGQMVVGGVGIIIVLTMSPIALMMASERAKPRTRTPTSEQIDELTKLVRSISDSANLSEEARRALNRANERDLLVQEIENKIARQDWSAAEVLTTELAERSGFPEEADRLRKRLEEARAEVRDAAVVEAISYLDGLILQRRWDVAFADAARIARLHPESPMAKDLVHRVEHGKDMVKAELQERFLAAAQHNHGTEAMSILKDLDTYITEQEAEPLREIARGVIARTRDTMGAEFKRFVQEKQWRQAAELGERIIAEFPNTRMAEEIRQVIEGVRENAGVVADRR